MKSVLGLKSDFIFKIAHLLGFPWDHHGLFATLSSRLVKIPGHKYYFVPTGTQPGQRPKNRDCPDEIGTLGNYAEHYLSTPADTQSVSL